MDTNKFAGMTAGIVVMLLLASAVLVPTIDGARMTTTTISNEGAGWAKFAYYEDSEDYSVALSSDGTTLTMGAQTGTADDMIVWASDSAAVIHDGGSFTLLYGDGDSSAAADLGNSATIASVSGALTITDSSSTDVYTSDAVEWSYTPNAGGSFGFFDESGATVKDFPVATAGSFAGAYAYNSINSLGLSTLVPTYSVSDGVFTSGDWEIQSEEDNAIGAPFTKSLICNAQVGPSTGTLIGDLYYTFSGTSAAVVGISSSLSSATSITIPDTVTSDGTTYNVTSIADGADQSSGIFSNLTSLSTVALSDNITYIGKYAFYGCTNLTQISLPDGLTTIGKGAFLSCTNLALTSLPDGLTSIDDSGFRSCTNLALTSLPDGLTSISKQAFSDCTNLALTSLPDGLTSIGNSGFRSCTNLALTSLPDGLTSIESYAFYGCTNLINLVILGSPTIASNSFYGCTNLAEILNLGDTEITAGSYGLSSDAVVQDYISSAGYIAPVSFSETAAREGAIYDLMAIIPLLIIASILLAVTSMIITRRD